ncbi:unnamed protein product [Brassica oleracea]
MSLNDAAKTGKIAVWWDMKECPVPEGIDAHRVRPSIEGGFKELGYSGPVSITAYGDQKQTPEYLLRALSSTGVAVVHVRSESTCAVMYEHMMNWREENPPPATMMIITNQMLDVFDWDLARLQQQRTGYHICLAYTIRQRAELIVDTRKEWLWEKLLLGTTTSTSAGELSTVFHCEYCSLDCQSLNCFKEHLSTKKHQLQEVIRPQRTELISATNKWGKNYAATPEYATAKIHVWWDMFDCPIPDGYDARRVRPSLEGAFKELGYSGPVSITAFGDHTQTPKRHLQALSSTGIDVAHATLGVISSRIFDDLMEWRGRITTPATMMIISDGVEELIAKLQQRIKFNLFWAYSCRPWTMSVVLTSAEWLWDSLLAVSATKRHVLRNCSASAVESTGMFYCKLCYTKRTLLDKFIKHLSSKKHLSEQEGCITDRRRRAKKHRLFWLKARVSFSKEQAVEECSLVEEL